MTIAAAKALRGHVHRREYVVRQQGFLAEGFTAIERLTRRK